MAPMRVTYFHYIYKTRGPLVQLSEFVKAFRALGHELNVHAMDEEPQASRRARIKENLKPYFARYLHEANTLRKNFSYYSRECRILKAEQPDLVFTRYKLYHLASAFAARRFHLPFVLWVDAPAAYEQRKYLREFFQIPGVAEWIERKLLERADRIILVSEESKQYLPKFSGLNGRVEVVTNGVDIERFNPSLDSKKIRVDFPEANPIVLGFVGSFAPWHGIESLKALMSFALSSYDHACFLLVGEGPRRSELERFIQSGRWDPRRVRFTGQVEHEEVPQYLGAMDICLLPYDQGSEGFYFSPLKLFEYLGCGKAVLAARVGQVEQVIEEGVNGLLYDSGDLDVAKAKCRRLIEEVSLRRRLGQAGRQTVLERYTWKHTACAVERILQDVLEKRQSPS